MSQALKKPSGKKTNKKYKVSEREERFSCNRKNHRKSEEACDRHYLKEIIERFDLKCKSKEQKNKNYLEYCRKIEQDFKNDKKRNNPNAYQDRMLKLKRCEFCLDPVNNDFLVFCNICEDGYHCYCLKEPVLDLDDLDIDGFTCDNCLKLQVDNAGKYRQTTMDESFHFTIKKNPKKCNHCSKEIKELPNYYAPSIISKINKSKKSNNSKKNILKISLNQFEESTEEDDDKNEGTLKTCTRCKKDFHKECFNNINNYNKNSISKSKTNSINSSSKNLILIKNTTESKSICGACEININQVAESLKISDFFKSQKQTNTNIAYNLKNNKTKPIEMASLPAIDQNSLENDIVMFDFEKKNENVAVYPKFILWKPLPDKKIGILKENLKNALIFKNIEFSDDLAFLDSDCPEEMNNAKLEPGIQKMSSYNKSIFYKFKQRTRSGEYPGLEIIEDPIQGHIVKAVEDLKKHTLICEYTGEVCLLRKKLFDTTNDSIMELIRHPSSSSSLVICPEKKGNIARFLSGINNSDKSAKKKQNVNSARYDINGKVHVILYASKAIKKGEILYYDYNAGGSGTYPTENFV